MKQTKKQHMLLARNKPGAYAIVTAMAIFLLMSLAAVSHLHSKIITNALSSKNAFEPIQRVQR